LSGKFKNLTNRVDCLDNHLKNRRDPCEQVFLDVKWILMGLAPQYLETFVGIVGKTRLPESFTYLDLFPVLESIESTVAVSIAKENYPNLKTLIQNRLRLEDRKLPSEDEAATIKELLVGGYIGSRLVNWDQEYAQLIDKVPPLPESQVKELQNLLDWYQELNQLSIKQYGRPLEQLGKSS
jgi:hypothetical protein